MQAEKVGLMGEKPILPLPAYVVLSSYFARVRGLQIQIKSAHWIFPFPSFSASFLHTIHHDQVSHNNPNDSSKTTKSTPNTPEKQPKSSTAQYYVGVLQNDSFPWAWKMKI